MTNKAIAATVLLAVALVLAASAAVRSFVLAILFLVAVVNFGA